MNSKIDKSWILFLAAAIIFLTIKTNAAGYAISDENTYYKMGQLVADGQVPYKDFFFAHTPLQVYLYAAIFKAFGFNLLLLKMLSAVATVITAAIIFAIAKEKLNAQAAIAAAAIFLFSYGTLLFSNFPTGAELSLPFATAGFHFFLKKKFFLAGALIGLATATYQLSALALAVLATATIFLAKDKKGLMQLTLGFLAAVAATVSIFLVLAKGEFISQTILYHIQKPSEGTDKAALLLRILKTNALLFITAAIAILTKQRAKTTVAFSAAIAAAYIAIFPLAKASFNYYAIYALPFLAVLSAHGINSTTHFLSEKARLTKAMSLLVVAAIVLTGSFFSIQQFAGYNAQDFPEAEEIAEFAKKNSTPEQTIFGDDSTVPLISLLSGREIALNHADSNVMRYRAGQPPLESTLQQLEEKVRKGELKLVILRRIDAGRGTYDFGIGTERKFLEFVDEKCKLTATFGQHHVYDCLKT
ncbi:glycosyltransferase family 39 protein [Candidatus Woesearchaeota archaeon]|nr:glycosyltransferase family 39 protein [Candidatus Woesearchaeota archaeon]